MERYPKKQIFVALCAYIGQILVGYALGWTAPVIPKLQDPEQTPLPNVISDTQASWIGSLLFIGCIIGPLVSSSLSNIVGRKPCFLLAAIVSLIAYLVLALAKSLIMIFIGRILMGLGNGIIFVVNLVYIGEIASTHIRGTLLTATGIFSSLGTLIVYSVLPYVSYSATGYIGVAISLVYMLGICFVPETPLFLVLKGEIEKAKSTLTFLGRETEIEDMLSSKREIPDKNKTKDQWIDIFRVKTNKKAFIITLTLNILQQMSGVLAVTFFVTTIFELADSSVEPHIATIIVGVIQTTPTFFTPYLVERSGRKFLLLISTAACSLSLGVLGTYFYLDSVGSSVAESVKWLPLLTLIIFYLSFNLGFVTIPGALIGEMFTPNVRSSGATVTMTISWIFGFGVVTAFGYMLIIGPYFAFWTYATGCALAFIFTAIFVPETKGKSLMEVQEMLSQ